MKTTFSRTRSLFKLHKTFLNRPFFISRRSLFIPQFGGHLNSAQQRNLDRASDRSRAFDAIQDIFEVDDFPTSSSNAVERGPLNAVGMSRILYPDNLLRRLEENNESSAQNAAPRIQFTRSEFAVSPSLNSEFESGNSGAIPETSLWDKIDTKAIKKTILVSAATGVAVYYRYAVGSHLLNIMQRLDAIYVSNVVKYLFVI